MKRIEGKVYRLTWLKTKTSRFGQLGRLAHHR